MLTAKQGAAKSAASRARVPDSARSHLPRTPLAQVIVLLEDLCCSLQPGDRIPTHLALMQQFQASERVVLQALAELQHRGRILRKRPLGTFVAEPSSFSPPLVNARTLVAVAPTDHALFDRCLDQLCHLAETQDFSLVCKPIPGDSGALSRDGSTDLHQSLIRSEAGGFILLSWRLAPLADLLQSEGTRVVLIGTPPAGIECTVPCVHGNQEYGGFLITSHLIDLGHRHLAFIHNSREELYSTRRWHGHERALQAAWKRGASVKSEVLVDEEILQWESDPGRAVSWVRRLDAPTGLICWNDCEAAKVLGILARAGVKVPEDISVTGYDALPEGERVYPRLTTVDQFIGEQVRIAFDFVTLPAPSLPMTNTILVPKVVIRESTSAPHSP